LRELLEFVLGIKLLW